MSAGMGLRELKNRVLERVRALAPARHGNVAMIFALALIPLCVAAGAGLDYARAVVVRSSMADAIDAAALAVGGSQGLTSAQMQTLAQQYFNANYKADPSFGTPAAILITPGTQQITISVTNQMPTTLLSVIGIDTIAVTASNKVVWGQLKLWVSLVLDNTGSMSETDWTGTSKMTALKSASHQLLTMLQNASSTAGDVRVAVVPFTKDVNLGTSYYNSSWLDWSDWDAANGSNKQICTGYGWYRYCYYTWVPADHNSWNGCITDRDQNFDVSNTTPTSSNTNTYFPTEEYSACPKQLLPLGYNWTALNNEIDGMVANGSTNQTIGLVWGWHALTQGAPLSPPALPANTQQVLIILSDGLNTQDRWYGNGYSQSSQVDARMALACTNAKTAGIVIYAVFVDLGGTQGNSTVLQNCASDASKYFDLTTSGAIVTTFNQIGQQITNLRVAQ